MLHHFCKIYEPLKVSHFIVSTSPLHCNAISKPPFGLGAVFDRCQFHFAGIIAIAITTNRQRPLIMQFEINDRRRHRRLESRLSFWIRKSNSNSRKLYLFAAHSDFPPSSIQHCGRARCSINNWKHSSIFTLHTSALVSVCTVQCAHRCIRSRSRITVHTSARHRCFWCRFLVVHVNEISVFWVEGHYVTECRSQYKRTHSQDNLISMRWPRRPPTTMTTTTAMVVMMYSNFIFLHSFDAFDRICR